MPDEPFEGRPSANWHYPARSTGSGAETVRVTPEHAGWGHAGLRVVELAPGASFDLATGEDEVVVLPLAGSCVVDAPFGHAELAGRPSVFEALTDYAYLPRDSPARLASPGGGRFALASARARRRLPFRHVRAEEVQVELRGAGTCSRQVNNFATPGVLDADRLIACEVLTPAGNWSSYPPHKHDEQRPGENELEEIYYFEVRTEPGGSARGADPVGYQRVYGTDARPIDVLAEVRSGDVVLVPHGWHGPAMAPPGYDLYYLNVMAGPGATRAWLICDDPAHGWVRESWAQQDVDPRLPIGGLR
jgi:5-deoxy-glucuronate isomerase